MIRSGKKIREVHGADISVPALSQSFQSLGNKEILRGRREILMFLGFRSWVTVRKWRDRFSLPIRTGPNGRPWASRRELMMFLVTYDKLLREAKTTGIWEGR